MIHFTRKFFIVKLYLFEYRRNAHLLNPIVFTNWMSITDPYGRKSPHNGKQ